MFVFLARGLSTPLSGYPYRDKVCTFRHDSFYCVCELPAEANCTDICPKNLVVFGYDDPRLLFPDTYFNETDLHFLVVGTNNSAGGRLDSRWRTSATSV
jgi:hypothetical protein